MISLWLWITSTQASHKRMSAHSTASPSLNGSSSSTHSVVLLPNPLLMSSTVVVASVLGMIVFLRRSGSLRRLSSSLKHPTQEMELHQNDLTCTSSTPPPSEVVAESTPTNSRH